jgi:ubiquinone biosynthesis protein UbiJ
MRCAPQADPLAAAIAELSALRAQLARLERIVEQLKRSARVQAKMEGRRSALH